MNNERARTVDVLFSRGVRQDIESRTAPLGALAKCDNLEFDKLNRLVRRGGFAQYPTTTYSKGNDLDLPVRRVAQTPQGVRLAFTNNNTFQQLSTQDKFCEAGIFAQNSTVRATLQRVDGITADETGAVRFADCAAYGGFVVYASVQNDASTGIFTIFFDVVDSTDGSRVLTRLSGGSADLAQPRCVFSGGSSVVFVVWKDAGNLRYVKFDFGLSTLSPSAPANLVTDILNVGGVFDCDQMITGWVLVYTQSTGPNARVVTWNSVPGPANQVNWLANSGASTWTPSALAVHGDFRTGDIRVAGYDPATFMMESKVFTSLLGSGANARFDPGLSHTKPCVQLTLCGVGNVTSLVLFSNYSSIPLPASPAVATNPRGHLHCYYMGTSAVLNLQIVYANYSLASKIFCDVVRGDYVHAVARFDDATGFQNHLLLLDFGNLHFGPYPTLHFASGRVRLGADNEVMGISGVADLSLGGSGQWRCAFALNIGASSISGNLVASYQFRSLGPDRFLNTNCSLNTIVGGGTPLAYDGQRLVELAFYSYPILNAGNITTGTVGGFMPQAIFQYRAVYEWTDAVGNRHQSPACPAITVDMSGGGFAAGTNSVFLTFPGYFPTRKQLPAGVVANGIADTSSPVRVVVYRTTGGGSVFYRMAIAAVNNNSSTAPDTVINDPYSDAQISVNEILYEKNGGRGELAATAPPPSLMMTTHAQRLWGLDAENPERIWCTKVIQDEVSPQYNQGLQITIPGAGRINGIGGQDGKLYALATGGIYLASYGDGPDNAGNGSFPSPQLITLSANCTEPRSVILASSGIYFVGDDQWGVGIYMIRRGDGEPMAIGRRVREELAACPVCRGAVDRVDKARCEFLFVNSDTNPTSSVLLYYHYDYLDDDGIGQWTVARVVSDTTAAAECVGIWDRKTVLAQTAGFIGFQDSTIINDFGADAFVTTIETCDIRPFGLTGFGRVNGVGFFGSAFAGDTLMLEASVDSGQSWSESHAFDAFVTGDANVLRRWETPTQKLPDGGSVRIRISDPPASGETPNQGIQYFHGLCIEAEPLSGNARLSSDRRG